MGEHLNSITTRSAPLHNNLNEKVLKFASLNVCGLNTRLEYPDFVTYFSSFDIICYQETKVDEFDILSLPGFTAISQPRKQRQYRKSGGLAIFIKDNISQFCTQYKTESDYILWISIDKSVLDTDENVILGSIYIPPVQSRYYNEDELAVLESEIISQCSNNKYVFINGDLNGRSSRLPDFTLIDSFVSDLFDFDDSTANFFDKTSLLENLNIPLERASKDHKTNTMGYWLIDTCKNNNLFIVNGRFGKDKGIGTTTFRDKSLIDYTLCSAESFEILHDFEIVELDPVFSDGHSLLAWSVKCNNKMNNLNSNESNVFLPKFKWSDSCQNDFTSSIDTTELQKLHSKLETIQPQQMDPAVTTKTINDITDSIAGIFIQAASTSLKQSKQPYKRKIFDKPWFGPACKIARKKYHCARNKYNKSKSTQAKNDLQTASKLYKKTMHKYIHLHKTDKTNKSRNMHSNQPKDYWKYLNSLQQKKNNNQPCTDDFYEHFKLINLSNEAQEGTLNINIENADHILNAKITSAEIDKCIKNLKNGKAPAQDKILNEYIKTTKNLFLPIYEALFNAVLDTGIIPSTWLEGTICPIYKNKGDPKNVSNYRPITILSCLGKLFTSVLNLRLTKFLDNNEYYTKIKLASEKGTKRLITYLSLILYVRY